ncbi:MAG TPA: hypothetical protein VKQ36_14105, partial [Ktedonobacterales bacterium]|nr:hypothetical protein [Ktedonobacterales bacterium]
FWGGEGLGVQWVGSDLFLLALIAFYLAVAGSLILWLRPFGSAGAGRGAQIPSKQPGPSAEAAASLSTGESGQ